MRPLLYQYPVTDFRFYFKCQSREISAWENNDQMNVLRSNRYYYSTQFGINANEAGEYSIRFQPVNKTESSFIGYKTLTKDIDLQPVKIFRLVWRWKI